MAGRGRPIVVDAEKLVSLRLSMRDWSYLMKIGKGSVTAGVRESVRRNIGVGNTIVEQIDDFE